jgi:hypothetical protein
VGTRAARYPTLDAAVNKRYLSTGETGEFVLENLGFDLNPRVELAPLRRLLSNWRHPACKNVRNVADTGASGNRRCCQDLWAWEFGTRTVWLPENHGFQLPLRSVSD